MNIRRRDFITLLGGAAAWPLTARAAESAKSPTIGYLGTTTPTAWGPWTAAFLQRLHELGWTEGRNLAIEYRWADGRIERYAEIAAEFVRLKVDVMVTGGNAALAAKQATSGIPIVFALADDPVGSGLIASLARPGANVTGLSLQQSDIAGKRLELLREMRPGLRRLGIMANVDYPTAGLEVREIQTAAGILGLDIADFEIRHADDITSAFAGMAGRADALYVIADALVNANRIRINTLALGARLPTMHGNRDMVEAGALMSYAANYADLFRHAGDYVDKILRGAKPADLPVEQPTKFDLVINLTTRPRARPCRASFAACPRRRGYRMRRGEFVMLLGGAAVLWPITTRAQQNDRIKRIGLLLGATTEYDPESEARVSA
jgi:putative ABC transport system substrate-binding protein